MKATTHLALALASFAACSAASATDAPQVDAGVTGPDLSEHVIDDLVTPLPPEPSLEIGPLERSRAARSLFTAHVMYPEELVTLIAENSTPLQVAEQRLVTRGFGRIAFAIELPPPSGRFSRTLISDVQQQPGMETTRVLCSYVSGGNNYATHDPRCKTATPSDRQLPAGGTLTTGHWSLSLMTSTNEGVVGCEVVSPSRLECELFAQGDDAEYHVGVWVNGVKELWNGSAGLGVQTLGGQTFAGAFADDEYKCLLFDQQPTSSYCTSRYVYRRFTGIDTARLELDPLTTRITVAGEEVTSSTPALTWEAGNADLPGAH